MASMFCKAMGTVFIDPASTAFFSCAGDSISWIGYDGRFRVRCPICGDADNSAGVDISDAVFLISYIFSNGPAPSPTLQGDANCDAAVDISDVVYLITFIFGGGAAPCDNC